MKRKRVRKVDELIRARSFVIGSSGWALPEHAKPAPPADPWDSFDRELMGLLRRGAMRVDPRTGEVVRV